MRKDPAHLASLGELATLKNAIGSWFHQDAYLDFASDEEIWTHIFDGHELETRQLLIDQLTALLQQGDDTVSSLWNSHAGSHSFTDGTEVRAFLDTMLNHFKGRAGAA